MQCKECGEKVNYISDIVTEVTHRFEQVDTTTEKLYQCPKCKTIIVHF